MTLKIIGMGAFGNLLGGKCPRATQDIAENLKNRQNAIKVAMYGPANPNEPGDYWQKIAGVWDVSVATAKTMRCGNCAAFDVTSHMRECIEQGLGGRQDAEAVIDAGVLGYCRAFRFKCASARTCSAWIVGGPIKDK